MKPGLAQTWQMCDTSLLSLDSPVPQDGGHSGTMSPERELAPVCLFLSLVWKLVTFQQDCSWKQRHRAERRWGSRGFRSSLPAGHLTGDSASLSVKWEQLNASACVRGPCGAQTCCSGQGAQKAQGACYCHRTVAAMVVIVTVITRDDWL